MSKPPVREAEASKSERGSRETPGYEGGATSPWRSPDAFAIPASRPLRITWPLEVGPGPEGITCLRSRQGVNELQNPGEGKALFPFRVARAGRYVSFLRVRWLDDGVGSVDCNNSWFAAIDSGPTVRVGHEEMRTDWFWEDGPAAALDAGVHWFRLELREDGVFLEKIAILPAGGNVSPRTLDALPPVTCSGLEGLRPPTDPATPVRRVEFAALRTGSIPVGRGHVNEVTVLASYQARAGSFRGRIVAEAPSAPGLVVEGCYERARFTALRAPDFGETVEIGGAQRRKAPPVTTVIECGAESPHARSVVRLKFPDRTERRVHRVRLSVVAESDQPECVFRTTLRFFRPPAWAFLGPFADPTRGRAGLTRLSDRELAPLLRALASRSPPERLSRGVPGGFPAAAKNPRGPVRWRTFRDAECYDELGAVDLFKVFGRTGNAFCYAVTWIRAENDLHHRSFVFQPDDTASLWIGGRLVATVPVGLPKEANRLWTSAVLRRGLNPVVAKIAQAGRYWGFRFDVIDWHWQGRRGDVIRGVEPEEWP